MAPSEPYTRDSSIKKPDVGVAALSVERTECGGRVKGKRQLGLGFPAGTYHRSSAHTRRPGGINAAVSSIASRVHGGEPVRPE